jgi:formylglycine-generating enzyme required for sulfatase activity
MFREARPGSLLVVLLLMPACRFDPAGLQVGAIVDSTGAKGDVVHTRDLGHADRKGSSEKPAHETGAPLPDGPKPPDGAVSIPDFFPPQPDHLVPDSWPTVPGTWVTVPAGTFNMGSPTSEICRDSSDEDLHSVTLTHAFAISITEVTQGQFSSVMGSNPSNFTSCGASCPVENINWNQAAAYCNGISKVAGVTSCYTCTGIYPLVTCLFSTAYATPYACPGFRLPTDAEWEYAARAGSADALYSANPLDKSCASDSAADSIGWYEYNGSNTTHEVAKKLPNAWGLYDMSGNVWEWTNDWYHDSLGTAAVTDPTGPTTGATRVYRGGSYWNFAWRLRAANRQFDSPTSFYTTFGFRCVRTL